MKASQNRLKSLKGTLLEYAVLNTDLLFPREGPEAIPIFPEGLFEEILWQSESMCWVIPKEHLMTCIALRDRLKWSEGTSFNFIRHVDAGDLKLFAGSMHALKVLKVTCAEKHHDLDFFERILKSADVLEDLEIFVFRKLEMSHAARTLWEKIEAIVGAVSRWMFTETDRYSLKLKRLSINLDNFEWLLPNIDPDKLTVLDLCSGTVKKHFRKTLAGLKQLVHFSLFDVYLDAELSMEELIEAIASLERLRILTLGTINKCADELVLNKITAEMKNLDVLELYRIKIDEPERLIAPRRKLKVLSYRFPREDDGRLETLLTGLAQRIGNFSSYHGLTTIMSYRLYLKYSSEAFFHLFIFREILDLEKMVEDDRNGILAVTSPLRLNGRFDSNITNAYDTSQKLICYLSKFRSYAISREIGDFMRRNKDTHLARKLQKIEHISEI